MVILKNQKSSKLKNLKNKYPIPIFLFTFVVLFFMFYKLLYLDVVAENIHPKIIYATAYLPCLIISLFGENVSFISGTTIASPGFSLRVIIDCCSVEPMAIFSAAVIAFPATWKQKLIGITFAIPVFFIINIIRIVSLYYVGAYVSLQAMDRVHLDIWQGLLILFSIVLCFFWIRWAIKNTKTSAHA